MSDVLPQFDQTTRTLKTRFELDNPDLILRPDMFVDVELEMKLPASVHVPVEAVLDSGVRKTVYVNRRNGFFEPRQVETGWRLGDRVEITKGLAPGERIVVSGNFLIDSESRMKSATAGAVHSIATSNTAGAETTSSAAWMSIRKRQTPSRPSTREGLTFSAPKIAESSSRRIRKVRS